MTQDQILENNRIIAGFMGGVWNKKLTTLLEVPVKSPLGNLITCIDKLKYHSSWDWLMIVVNKIEEIENGEGFKYLNVTISKDECEIRDDVAGEYFAHCSDGNKIEFTYMAIVEFIKNYTSK